jgi:hypothetical protein
LFSLVYRDKKVVGVFVPFSCAASLAFTSGSAFKSGHTANTVPGFDAIVAGRCANALIDFAGPLQPYIGFDTPLTAPQTHAAATLKVHAADVLACFMSSVSVTLAEEVRRWQALRLRPPPGWRSAVFDQPPPSTPPFSGATCTRSISCAMTGC